MFRLLFKSLVRPILEYAAPVWNPYKKHQMRLIEKIQRRATKQLPGMAELTYSERLEKLEMTTLVYRRMRGDLIEAYKILSGKYDENAATLLKTNNSRNTRGHRFKLEHQASMRNVRKKFFSLKICKIWNDLSEDIVSAQSTDSFERTLDICWIHKSVKLDPEASYVARDNSNISLHDEDLSIEEPQGACGE